MMSSKRNWPHLPHPSVLWMLLGLVILAQPATFAAEAGVGHYWPGFRNYMAGVIPAKPGLYLRNDIVGYQATAPRVVLNGLPVEGVSADVVVDLVEPLYVLPKKLFGATHAIVLTQPFAWTHLAGTVTGPGIMASGTRVAASDLVVSPLYLGWHKGKLHYNTNLAIFVPTGDYDVHRVVNMSLNYWTFDPEFAITHMDPETGWDLSGVIGYSFNTENAVTHYRSGQVLHIDYAIGKRLKSGWKPGIMGYAWMQVTPDTGSGAIFGSFESRVYGIGPIVQLQADAHKQLAFRYIHEFAATNHLKGNQYALTLRMAF